MIRKRMILCFNPLNLLRPASNKRNEIISYAMQDKFFAKLLNDLRDFGYEISFSSFGGAGEYQPFALSTEKIDSPEKQHQFASGFWSMIETGGVKSKFKFSNLLSVDINAHSFLHEMMHFYQDMHGIYLLPLQEQGEFPVLLDAKGDIVATMFCEAWAQVEAIRTSWALQEKGSASGWNGAINSPDWKGLARAYDNDLRGGVDEAVAAAKIFKLWYEGKQRIFYEKHAIKAHESNLERYLNGTEVIKDNFRMLELPMLIVRIPKEGMPNFFHQIDWEDELYSSVTSSSVLARVQELEEVYGKADNTNLQQIKCGSPPYLWHRLREADKQSSEVPPH